MNDPTASAKVKEYLNKIGGSAQHLLGIINDILDMSRIESGRMTIRKEEFSFAKALEHAEIILGQVGISCETAETGWEGVELFESHEPGYYDAILIDMRMPEMDGLEATRIIRASEHDDANSIPIIALTANAFDEDVQRILQSGLNAHLSKPVEPEALFETLEKLIK